jgi:phage terminase large subunit GpA-like protein
MPGCRITKNFEAGSQEMPFVPFPHCSHMQILTWDNMAANLDPARPQDAHFTCVSCGSDAQRNLDLVLMGKWRNCVGREIGVDFAAIDGNARTEDVWSFARRHPSNRLIMVRGRGDDSAPRLALVKRERDQKTGVLLAYSSRFYNLGTSGLKMALYRDLQKTDETEAGHVAFPSGLPDEYFQELTAERRTAIKRHGFTVYRWVKDDRQDNEALDTMIIATGAAARFGVYGMSDRGWERHRLERETPPQVHPPGTPRKSALLQPSRLAR